jgi:hypothetical protein
MSKKKNIIVEVPVHFWPKNIFFAQSMKQKIKIMQNRTDITKGCVLCKDKENAKKRALEGLGNIQDGRYLVARAQLHAPVYLRAVTKGQISQIQHLKKDAIAV